MNELRSKVKKTKEKTKKAPDDLKAQLKAFLAVSEQWLCVSVQSLWKVAAGARPHTHTHTHTTQESEAILSELTDSLDSVSERMRTTSDYFCIDSSKFKLEELLTELLRFIKEVENAVKVCCHGYPIHAHPLVSPQENKQRVLLEEKRRKREEQKKAAEEARKKKLEAKGQDPGPPPPEESDCIIDNLLKEIRAGTTLRATNRTSVRKSRRKSQLNAQDLAKLSVIMGQAAAHPRSSSSEAPKVNVEDMEVAGLESVAPSDEVFLTNESGESGHVTSSLQPTKVSILNNDSEATNQNLEPQLTNQNEELQPTNEVMELKPANQNTEPLPANQNTAGETIKQLGGEGAQGNHGNGEQKLSNQDGEAQPTNEITESELTNQIVEPQSANQNAESKETTEEKLSNQSGEVQTASEPQPTNQNSKPQSANETVAQEPSNQNGAADERVDPLLGEAGLANGDTEHTQSTNQNGESSHVTHTNGMQVNGDESEAPVTMATQNYTADGTHHKQVHCTCTLPQHVHSDSNNPPPPPPHTHTQGVVLKVADKLHKRDMGKGLAALSAMALSLVPEGSHVISDHDKERTHTHK